MGTFFSRDESRWLTAEILLRSSSRSGLLAGKTWRRGLVLMLCSGCAQGWEGPAASSCTGSTQPLVPSGDLIPSFVLREHHKACSTLRPKPPIPLEWDEPSGLTCSLAGLRGDTGGSNTLARVSSPASVKSISLQSNRGA